MPAALPRAVRAAVAAALLGATAALASAAPPIPSKEPKMSDALPLPSFDRGAPPAVPPVTRGGVTYEQNLRTAQKEFGQAGGVLSARDAKGKVLWSIKVYDNARRPDVEGDVQDVFFASMAFDGQGRLVIRNESGKRFAVDVDRRSVEALP